MNIQKNFWSYFMFCSFFLSISLGAFAENIEREQDKDQETQQLSRSYRLSKYGVLALSGLLTGSLGGYICGKFDNKLGFWGIVCTWPLFASLRDFTLACAEREIRFSIDAKDKERSSFKLMKIIARLTEWAVWLAVISDRGEMNVPPFPIMINITV